MKSFLKGLFFGMVVGGITGLLKAPQKGSQTRQQIMTYVHETNQEIKDYIDQTNHDVEDIRLKVENLSQSLQGLSNQGLASIREAQQGIAKSLQRFSADNEDKLQQVQAGVNKLQKDLEDI